MEFKYIVNPETNRKCSVNTPAGKNIIKMYLQAAGGDCKYNDKTSRCSLRKDGAPNDPNCHFHEGTNRCRINDSKRDKVCLDVPYLQKDVAKSMGARWDPSAKSWWTSSTNTALISRYGKQDCNQSPKPAAKPAPKPAAKPAPKPVAKPAPKPAAKPAPKPAAKPVPKPAAKPAPKPAAKPAVQPVRPVVEASKPKNPRGPRERKSVVEISKSAKGTDREMCVVQKAKKYTSRKSPPYPASACCVDKQFIHRGNDGELYYAKQAVDGTCRWVKCKSEFPGCP